MAKGAARNRSTDLVVGYAHLDPDPPGEETLREQSYLIARGVRPLALAGQCRAVSEEMVRAATRLEAAAEAPSIPFVLDRGDGTADFGYAGAPWVIDLLRWAEAAPSLQRDRILGLLLGYSADAIRAFEDRSSGRRFPAPTWSGESGASSPVDGSCGRAGTARPC